MTRDKTIWLGAVAYNKDVVDIWEGMRDYFQNEADTPVEILLFLNYEAQVEALLGGRIDIAWNTNLAYLQCEAKSGGDTRGIAMRDTDVGWTTKIIAPVGGDVQDLGDLKGKTLALGSRDSGHAAILPVHYLAQEGLEEGRDYDTLRFDLDVGKHGDTGTSEQDVLQAVLDGRAQAGAVGSPFWASIQEQGLVPKGALTEVWTTPAYNHCMFTVNASLDEATVGRFTKALFAMDYENADHRPILEAEGLRKWIPAREDGYDALRDAMSRRVEA